MRKSNTLLAEILGKKKKAKMGHRDFSWNNVWECSIIDKGNMQIPSHYFHS